MARDGNKTCEGSSVIEAEWYDQRNSVASGASGKSFALTARGEAVAVEVGKHGYLFGLLVKVGYPAPSGSSPSFDQEYPARVLFDLFGPKFPAAYQAALQDLNNTPELLRLIASVRDEVRLPPDSCSV